MARGGRHGAKVAPSPNVQALRQAEVTILAEGPTRLRYDLSLLPLRSSRWTRNSSIHLKAETTKLIPWTWDSVISWQSWPAGPCPSAHEGSLHAEYYALMQERTCPLCIEPLDATEQLFFPCACG